MEKDGWIEWMDESRSAGPEVLTALRVDAE